MALDTFVEVKAEILRHGFDFGVVTGRASDGCFHPPKSYRSCFLYSKQPDFAFKKGTGEGSVAAVQYMLSVVETPLAVEADSSLKRLVT